MKPCGAVVSALRGHATGLVFDPRAGQSLEPGPSSGMSTRPSAIALYVALL